MPYYVRPQALSLSLRAALPLWRDGKKVLQRVFEAACALAGLALLSPLFAAIAVAIKLDDGGPIFFRQDRVGKDLRIFQLMKFRSMQCGRAKEGLLTARRDGRVTRTGRVLRKTKLDELPQLIHVLTGEMQLVGVRPQVTKYVEARQEEYRELLREPPGVTGLSSLCFRNEEEMYEEGRPIEEQYLEKILPPKLQIALEYARRRTFRSDLEIIFRTLFGLGAPLADDPPFANRGSYRIHRNDELDKGLRIP